MSLPAWQEIDAAIAEIGAPCGAAEAHGMLCGLLALGAEHPARAWQERALGLQALMAPFDALYEETGRQIDDTQFALELLLPEDEEADLEQRTRALADWCSGFSTGAGLSGRSESRLSNDAREFLGDAAHIASAAVASPDDDEAAFAEVVEYVRMGCLLVRTECAGEARPG